MNDRSCWESVKAEGGAVLEAEPKPEGGYLREPSRFLTEMGLAG